MHRKRVLPLLACAVLLASVPSSYAFQSSPSQAWPEPLIENKLQYIEVSVARKTDKGYILSLKNMSAKPVIAWAISIVVNGEKGGDAYINVSGEPVIAPGKISTAYANIPVATLKAIRENPALKIEQPKITVSVAFADLTFEGHPSPLISVLGIMIGEKIESVRIAVLLQSALESKEQDSSKVLESLRQQASVLSEEYDKQQLTIAGKYLPQPPKEYMTDLESAVRVSVFTAKASLLDSIKKFKAEETSLREWLVKTKNSYEERIKELSSFV